MAIILVLLIHLRRLHVMRNMLHFHGLLRILLVVDLLIITIMIIVVWTSSRWLLGIAIRIRMSNRRATSYSVLT